MSTDNDLDDDDESFDWFSTQLEERLGAERLDAKELFAQMKPTIEAAIQAIQSTDEVKR